MNTTTRRHPRTLREAFPFDQPFSVEGPHKARDAGLWGDIAGVIVTIALVALLVNTLIDWAALP